MIPKKYEKKDFEKVSTGDFINGKIADIQYEEEHEFKFQGDIKIRPACRFVFELEGYKFKHYSRWLTFSYGEKTNLYKKFLVNLVLGAMPDMEFDLDNLKEMPIKTIWKGEEFQSIEVIRPLHEKWTDSKVGELPNNELPNKKDTGFEDMPEETEEETPF